MFLSRATPEVAHNIRSHTKKYILKYCISIHPFSTTQYKKGACGHCRKFLTISAVIAFFCFLFSSDRANLSRRGYDYVVIALEKKKKNDTPLLLFQSFSISASSTTCDTTVALLINHITPSTLNSLLAD
jgi:hypothetical protein